MSTTKTKQYYVQGEGGWANISVRKKVQRCEQSAAQVPNEKLRLPVAAIAVHVEAYVKYKRVITKRGGATGGGQLLPASPYLTDISLPYIDNSY